MPRTCAQLLASECVTLCDAVDCAVHHRREAPAKWACTAGEVQRCGCTARRCRYFVLSSRAVLGASSAHPDRIAAVEVREHRVPILPVELPMAIV